MAWDLRRALLSKEEFESARLTDFEFREMVRALKAMADDGGLEREAVLAVLMDRGLASALELFPQDQDGESREARWLRLRAEARRILVAERGDPTPHRLG